MYGAEAAAPAEYLPEIVHLGSGVVLALEELGVDEVTAAPLPIGGQSQGEPFLHPLTAEFCRDASICGLQRGGQPTTVGGAAVLTAIARRYGPLPPATLVAAGYATRGDDSDSPQLQLLLADQNGQAEPRTNCRHRD